MVFYNIHRKRRVVWSRKRCVARVVDGLPPVPILPKMVVPDIVRLNRRKALADHCICIHQYFHLETKSKSMFLFKSNANIHTVRHQDRNVQWNMWYSTLIYSMDFYYCKFVCFDSFELNGHETFYGHITATTYLGILNEDQLWPNHCAMQTISRMIIFDLCVHVRVYVWVLLRSTYLIVCCEQWAHTRRHILMLVIRSKSDRKNVCSKIPDSHNSRLVQM